MPETGRDTTKEPVYASKFNEGKVLQVSGNSYINYEMHDAQIILQTLCGFSAYQGRD
jgi:hypothetical protein